MLKILKKQNAFVIALEFAIILFIVFGVSYAIYNLSSNFKLKTIELGIDTDIYGNTSIDSSDIKLIPIQDSNIATDQSNVLKINFKVRGNKNNVVNNIIYDIALVNLEIDCELVSEYLKWQLLKNDEIISSGNFSPDFDTIIDDRLVLTNTQQTLLDYSSEPDNYEFRLWLSDSCQTEDILECSPTQDQSNLLNKSISGRIEIELYTGSKSILTRTPQTDTTLYNCIKNLDTSGANKPNMNNNMLAVYYDETNDSWKKADSKNSNPDYQWYNYNNQKWANAIVVKDYKKYESSKLGTTIENEDIIAFYVWIPRYSYQVWNIEQNKDNSNNYLNGININFETGKNDSGSITCTTTKCVGNNSEYLTHPAFTQNNIKGFWISKYEISGSIENPRSIPSNESLVNYSIESALNTSLKILDYGITNLTMDITANLNWGAISYLTYSNYGICKNNTCIQNIDSTTNNIYGVYHLNSKNNEMVKLDSFILGSATDEIGIDSSKLNNSPLYRSGLFKITEDKSNASFRNILY